MTKRFSQLVVLTAFCLLFASVAAAQTASVGTLTGTISDATGAVIAGADIKAKDDATGAVVETKSGADGSFTIASLRPGNYSVTVTMSGFKTGEFRNVKIIVGQVYDLSGKLEVGEMQSTVVVEAGAEVLETASTTIGTTITGRSIQTLPLSSRDALDLAILMPGAATTGRARQTSFMGLPKGAINITMDGINAQDNLLKSSDGFFTIIRPRIDAIEEFSIATAGQGADQSSEGAVQIRFETTRGGNEYHGGVWWYHRNDFFNSNYFFSNQQPPGVASTPRQRQRLNQFGGKVGGPIIKEKAFFFVALDNYRNPSSQVRGGTNAAGANGRYILSPNSQNGLFEYQVASPVTPAGTAAAWTTCAASSPRGANGNGPTCTVNLFTMSASASSTLIPGQNVPLIADPVVAGLMSTIAGARTAAGVAVTVAGAGSHLDALQFNNPGDATRRFPDVRLDYNPAKAHQISFIYHYNYFVSTPDFLNNFDRTFPVAPFDANKGSQISNRNQWTTSWRWNMAANKSNELRAGLQTAPVSFFPDLDTSIYPQASTNLGSFLIRPTFPLITTPHLNISTQGRNTALAQLIETFSWTKGKHSFTFGATFTELRLKSAFSRAQATAAIGANAGDPFTLMNRAANFPGSVAGNRTNAIALMALLAGRVNTYAGTVSASPVSRTYAPGENSLQRINQSEFGIYGQDQWRILPTLTINYGVRWEYQGAPKDPDNLSYRVAGNVAGVFGVSGANNFFQPGNLPGAFPIYELNGDQEWYSKDMNNWAPNLGLAWTPSMDNKLYNMIFGGPGKTVFRANYSVTFTREGINNFASITQSNPGFNASIFTTATANLPAAGPIPACPATNATIGTYVAGCVTLNNLTTGSYLQSLNTNPAVFPDATSFAIRPYGGQSVNAFDPDLAIPLVHNWSFGIQREINPNLVVEVRYVGNHGQGLWRQDNVNEVNIFESGFLQEFLSATNNFSICNTPANVNACLTAAGQPLLVGGVQNPFRSFANLGLAGQTPVPLLTSAFTGLAPAGQTAPSQLNGFFSNATFITQLNQGAAGSFANSLTGNQFMCNLAGTTAVQGLAAFNPCAAFGSPVGGGFPVNLFMANPHATSGAFRFYNGTHSTYNGMTLEARHRPSKGLQFNANYTWSKSLTNLYADSSVNFLSFDTLRDQGRNKGISPWDLRHAFKMQMIYELPFGAGKRWSSSASWVNHIVGGWEVSAIQRWQSGRVFLINSGLANGNTFNQNDPGVQLVGITTQQLQEMLEIRKTPTGQVFYFPASLIASNGQANQAFIRPCNTPGQFCQRPFLYGPSFYRADISIIKNIKIWEKVRFEYRAEFLNAFNNINFFYPGSETTSVPVASAFATAGGFGQVGNAFRDVSTTDDNGGRIIQMVFRIHF